MADPERVQKRIIEANGEADWHVSINYEDDDLTQIVSIRPEYDHDDSPYKGDVTLHTMYSQPEEDRFGETLITVPAQEMAGLCRQYLAALDAGQFQHRRTADALAEEDDDDAGDDDEGDDDEGEGDDDEGEGDDDEGEGEGEGDDDEGDDEHEEEEEEEE